MMKLFIVTSLAFLFTVIAAANEPASKHAEIQGLQDFAQNRQRIENCGRQYQNCLDTEDFTACSVQLQGCVEDFSLQNPENDSMDIWAVGGP